MGSGLECASPYDVRRGCGGSGGVGCVVRWRSCDVAPPAHNWATSATGRGAVNWFSEVRRFLVLFSSTQGPPPATLVLSLSLSLVSCVGWPSRMGSIITDESPSSSDGAWLSQKQQQHSFWTMSGCCCPTMSRLPHHCGYLHHP
jgi:hypothetical protein